MRPTTLFPDEEFRVEPAPDRVEPVLWVRRLVVVAERSPGTAVVREVPFRLGLNVVRVAERPPGEDRPIGHSVGKTLLTRLIRYCLGESHFAVQAVLNRIAGVLPRAHVLAEVNVAGRPWVVVRPLRIAPTSASWAAQAADWRVGLGDAGGLQRAGDFLDAVGEAVLHGLPELPLPDAKRPARWLDLFAWLARDQECSYQHPNEWRDPDANSGTGRLHLDDASLLMRWAMGLLDPREIRLVVRHEQLLDERADAQADADRLRAYLHSTLPDLRTRVGLGDAEVGETLFAPRAFELAEQRVQSLERLLADFTDDAEVARLHADAVQAAQAAAVAESQLVQLRGLRQEAEGELRQRRQADADAQYTTFDPRRNCPVVECPFRAADQAAETADPERATRIAELEAALVRYRRQIEELDARLPVLRQDHAAAEGRYVQERRRREGNIRGTLTEIGRWQLLEEQVRDYQAARRGLDNAEGRQRRLDGEIRESRERQEAARETQADKHRRLTRYFDWTLKRLLGPQAGGAVRLDARGLHPAPDGSVAANGAALGALATVLGLDLACLAASVCGLGGLPGFLMHDSPKEADMEPVLYERIFTLALELERAFGKRQPTFQYIVTTTTAPPGEVGGEPYTRLTLDARADGGLLLGVRF